MNETFDGSFKIYVDPRNNNDEMEMGRGGIVNDPYGLEMFSREVDIVKEDMKNLEKLYSRLQESNEEIKIAQNSKTMKELRARLNMDLDHLLKVAKQINKKFDGLIRANAAQRRVTGNGPGSSDDRTRASMISDLGENLKYMMRKFQGLRAQMETEHRQLIESRYFAITREKATAEAIDNLIASEGPENPLHHAMQEYGRGPVLDAVAEIQERRDTMIEIRRNLMVLHQILLGIATPVTASPVEAQVGGSRGGGGGGGPPSPVETLPVAQPPVAAHGAAKAGTGGLNDYEKETRKQAYIAMAIALMVISSIVVLLLKTENQIENGGDH
ncbi:SNARE protein Syntaxin 1 [Handroanthus impetiginosus]|uniref:SNARE protein Syntaxin 1 n=1 Tax=Handroanthus impetiginosus TaxID=429701 RepID=A0A2G9GZW9_9LAMI|nr:SNARE protein Syntaxin 1 [Handroanthus impetiginosus]